MSVNEKMTALADEVRELSGTNNTIGIDDMKTYIEEANAEIASQVSLLSQAIDALNGKMIGGGVVYDPSADYQRVEYINTSDGAYITTDVYADNNTGVEMIASFPSVADHVCMGSRQDSGNTRFYAPYPLSTTSTYFGFNAATKISATITLNTPYHWQTNLLNSRLALVCDISGTNKGSVAISATLASHSAPIHIFSIARGDTGAVTSPRKLNLYGARISQGCDIVRNYIPCYRKSDNEIGLYDTITGQFLSNAADVGEFTIGPEIEWQGGIL